MDTVNNTNKLNRKLKVDIAIFTAISEELLYYKELLAEFTVSNITINNFTFPVYQVNGFKVLLSETGLGTAFAASILTFVHQNFTPNYVFMSGTAGAINSKLNLCDVIIAENAFEAEIQNVFPSVLGTPFESCLIHPLKNKKFPANYPASNKLLNIAKNNKEKGEDIYFGDVVTSNNFPAPTHLFEDIKSLNPLSIDMETSSFYQTAWLFGIEALAIRSISNILNIDGTDDHIDKSDVAGSSKAAAVATMKIVGELITN